MTSHNWKTVKIKDLGRVVTGKTPSKDNPEHFGSLIPFITPSDMNGCRIVKNPLRRLSSEGSKALSRLIIPKGVGVSCIGWQMGKSVLINEPSVTNQQINTIIPNDEIVDYLFLYYAMCPRRDEFFRLASGGSRTPILKKSDFECLPFLLPPLPEQRAIARIFSSLDDKIELNQQMNGTLEAIARAIFKSWFVDFDPIRAKMDGRQPVGMDAATADLFPDEFEESPLGKIPKGWKFSTLNEVSKIVDSLHQTPSYSEHGYPMVRVTDIKGGYLDLSNCKRVTEAVFEEFTKKYTPQKEDIVLSRVGTYGISSYVGSDEKFCLGQNTVVIHPKIPSMYLYLSLQTPDVKDQIEMSVVGSTQKTISLQNIKAITIILPPQSVLTKFSKIINPIFKAITKNISNSNTISAIRNALLPRLLSGKSPIK
jgi:type I restriction enzyme S subunit